jgi:hypothetical protein
MEQWPKSYDVAFDRAFKKMVKASHEIANADDESAHYWTVEFSREEADARFPSVSYDGQAYDRVLDWRTALEEAFYDHIGRPELSEIVSKY